MSPPDVATPAHFQLEVAELLELPPGSGDAEVRNALRAKGPDFEAWYDTRLQATLESSLDRHYTADSESIARRAESIGVTELLLGVNLGDHNAIYERETFLCLSLRR
jgi:hypothetical protein